MASYTVTTNLNTQLFPGHTLGEWANNNAFAMIKADGSVIAWGWSGGDSNAVAKQLDGTIDVEQIFSTSYAFAALRTDGSVITWGYYDYGGNSNGVADQLDGTIDVEQIFSTQRAFAALCGDGSVVTWGSDWGGGDSRQVAKKLDGSVGIEQIFSTDSAFAALRANGSVVTWGYADSGGNSSSVTNQLDGAVDVKRIYSTAKAFAALRADGSVVSWGSTQNSSGMIVPIDSSAVTDQLDGTVDVVQIYSTGFINGGAFAALRADGSVITWGRAYSGGDSSYFDYASYQMVSVASQLDGRIDVTQIFSTDSAFAALRADGSVVTWGGSGSGGDSSLVANQLDGTVAVTQIFATKNAFAALRVDGSVVIWGDDLYGGNSSKVASQLNGSVDVIQVFSSESDFAALRTDGSVVTWGLGTTRGNSRAVTSQLDGTIAVKHIYATSSAFAALRTDGSMVTWGNDSSAVTDELNSNIASGADINTDDVYSPTYKLTSTAKPVLFNGRTVDEVANQYAFAAIKSDGSVVTWGFYQYGGDSSTVASQLDGAVDVRQIFSTGSAFAALRVDGSVVTWGSFNDRFNTFVPIDNSLLTEQLDGTIDVKKIFSSTGSDPSNGAFAALRADGSVVTWGTEGYGGDSSVVTDQLDGTVDVVQIFSTSSGIWGGAFAALRVDGSVVSWGYVTAPADTSLLDGTIKVKQIFSTSAAFAALRVDGSVVSWGDAAPPDTSQLDGTIKVKKICATEGAFAALRTDGSVITWGDSSQGGDSSAVANRLDGRVNVKQIFATRDVYAGAFAALRADGSVVTWGDASRGGDSSAIASQLNGRINVKQIYVTYHSFAALRVDGSVVIWGETSPYIDENYAAAVASQLDGTIDVVQLFSTNGAFAALRADGSVVTWGNYIYFSHGDNNAIAKQLDGTVPVKQIVSTTPTLDSDGAFAALRADGSVVTWGSDYAGGNSSLVANQLDGTIDVIQIFSNAHAFSALRADGSVVTWGDYDSGGNSSAVADQLSSDVANLANPYTNDVFKAIPHINLAPTGSAYLLLSIGAEDSVYTLHADELLRGFRDADNADTLSVSNLRANHGSLMDNSNGTWRFTPTANYNGKIALNYKVSDGNGGTVAVKQSFNLAQVNDAPNGEINILGRAQKNETLTIKTTLSDADGLGKFHYQWQADGVDISSATARTYTLTASEIAKKITVQLSYTDKQGTTETVTSSPTLSVAANQDDSMPGTNDADTLYGGYGNDELNGLLRDDKLYGQQGNDVLYGDYGNDLIYGGIGNDMLYGGYGNDALYGEKDNDLLFGEQGADYLAGGSGNDTLTGGVDDLMVDTLVGGTGDDTYYIGYGAIDVVNDQGLDTDIDTVIMPYQLTVYTLPTGIENGVAAEGTQPTQLTGNDSNNTLTGNDGGNILIGDAGVDTLIGGSGDDTVDGGDDNDVIIGGNGEGDDIYNGGTGVDTVIYTSAITGIDVNLAQNNAHGNEIDTDQLNSIENITCGQAGDTYIGDDGDNRVDGYTGNDTLTGGLGNDTFFYEPTINSGLDLITDFSTGDRIQVSGAVFNTTLSSGEGSSLGQSQVQVSNNGGITTLSIGTDAIPGADLFINLTGNYSVGDFSLNGTDILFNNKPVLTKPTAIIYADTIFDDSFKTNTGTLTASDVDDNTLAYGILGGTDNGEIFSQSNTYGILTVNKASGAYSFSANDTDFEALKVNTGTSFTVTVTDGLLSDSQTLTINVTQNGVTESIGNDLLIGTSANNKFDGLAGNDTISGLAGIDTLAGGLGKDMLTGGLGADIFKFNSEFETGITATTRDTITDFKQRNESDKIDLSAIDANIVLAGNNSFAAPTVGGNFSGVFANPGELYFDKNVHVLYGNNDADSQADFSILLTGVSSLSATDFVL